MPEKIVYDMSLMKFLALFESITRVQPKDVLKGNKDDLIFLVPQNSVGQAVGKRGINVQKLENIIKKRIRIVEFDDEPVKFIQNFIYPFKIIEGTHVDGTITLRCPDTKTKALLIGRESSNLEYLTRVVSRYFSINNIKVV